MPTTSNHTAAFLSQVSRPLSTYGDDNTFAALHVLQTGDQIRLQCEIVIYAGGSTYDYELVGIETAPDEEEAIGAAVDLEHAAVKRLREMDVRELSHDPAEKDFQEAIEGWLNRVATQHAIAAE